MLDEWQSAGEDVPEFAGKLVIGVSTDRDELDRVLGEHADDWSVERMAAVDRAILRLATYEVQNSRPDVPIAVAIDEAVEAAKELSTDESGQFVNGILGRIAREREDRGHGARRLLRGTRPSATPAVSRAGPPTVARPLRPRCGRPLSSRPRSLRPQFWPPRPSRPRREPLVLVELDLAFLMLPFLNSD